MHRVFGDLWTPDDVESLFPVGVAVTAPVASTSLADLPDEEVFYYDTEGDEVPHAALVSAGLKRR